MVQLSDSSLFKGTLLDSFEKNGYVSVPQPPPQNFFEKAKKLVSDHPKATIGALTVGGAVLGPLGFVGLVGAAGFGSGGIAAGSLAAWMMSLQGGATAAGSLVAILQSIGAAGLGMTGTLITSTAGATVLGALAMKLNENPEGLAQLDNFVKIYDQNGENSQSIVVFEMRNKLLNNDKALDDFLKIFGLTKNIVKTKQFRFLMDEAYSTRGFNILNNRLVTSYGKEHVEQKQQSIILNFV
ncbi:4680_t:CDS:1 [Dentiscutata erythropus]|uniref:4680_t:CDS:1 n=1 Tax=Dentiscutata erythropus TaxID=1348616 RepID=A0A9N9K100_9GLOM|nr:4680_t:CDS:1 [Dentiscutata erythropus]